jgi:hypothetical protein
LRGLLQDGRGDRDFVAACQTADDGRRGLGNRRELLAHFGKRNARTDIRERPDFDCFDESFEHIVEQLDLFLIEVPGRCQEQVGYAPGGFQAFFGRAAANRGLDLIDDGALSIKHCSS